MPKKIYFRVDGDDGKFSGLGHIYRSLLLYKHLKKRLKKKYKYVFLSKYSQGIQILKKKNLRRGNKI